MSFQDTWHEIGHAVKRHFPDAKECVEWNIKGWKVHVQGRPDDWKGTFDPEWMFVLPDEKQAGITTHIWDPRNPELLRQHEPALQEAGFKVMVGCLQWNKKAPYPVEAVEAVLAGSANQ